MYFVYIIKSEITNKYYIGCTSNLEKRFEQHNKGENYSTKKYVPWKLICYSIFLEQKEAFNYEKKVKSYKGGNAFKRIINKQTKDWVFV